MELLHSVEFYVIIFVIAAFAVALMALPSGHGPVETDFANGLLSYDPTITDQTPRIELECKEDGTVKITRYGLPDDLNTASTVALAITRHAFDLTIEERITPAASQGGSTPGNERITPAYSQSGSMYGNVTSQSMAGNPQSSELPAASKALLDSEITPANNAVFYLTGLAHERYHIKYNSDSTSSFTTLTVHNRPGLRSTRLFRSA
jgi:hypothetical protein